MLGVVTAQLDCGASADEIGAQLGLDPAEVEAHLRICCKPPEPPVSVEQALQQSDERLQVLSDRISTAVVSSGLSGDSRSALSGLSLAVRVELENRRRLEEQAKTAPRTLPRDPAAWSDEERERHTDFLDSIVSKYGFLAELEPETVLAECAASLDGAGRAAQSQLRDELRRYAFVWCQLQGGIRPGDEFWKNLNYSFNDLRQRYEQAEPLAVRPL
jgi:hypothetical protein